MKSFLLDLDNWDLTVDAAGNFPAICEAPYAVAQDVATAVRTFVGDCWYDASLGIPYFEEVLGFHPPVALFQELMVDAALSVVGVVDSPAPVCTITDFTQRVVKGSITFTDNLGNEQTVTLS
jgi:hypothetical protein